MNTRNIIRGLFLAVLVVSSLGTPSPLPAKDKPKWELLENKNGIKAYRREIPGSPIVQFKGTGLIRANLVDILAIMADIDRFPEWVDKVRELKIIEQVNKTTYYYYGRIAAPWPFKDRDYVALGKFLFDEKNGWIHIKSKQKAHPKMPEQSCCVRMPLTKVHWGLKPLGEKKVWIEFHAMADPGGNIPAWVANLVSKELPYKSIRNLRRRLKKIKPNPKFVKEYEQYRTWGWSKQEKKETRKNKKKKHKKRKKKK